MKISDLAKPFPVEKISWRLGATKGDKTSGIALAYIDSRDVMERLDEVCGIGGWQNKHPHAEGKTSCAIGIKIGDEWVWKENGAGDSQVEAEKGAFSDSFKRAGVLWGIGRYLYDLGNTWVNIEPAGRSYKIKKGEQTKLNASLQKLMREKFDIIPGAKTENDKTAAKALGGAIAQGLSDEDRIKSYNQGITLLGACATQEKLKEVFSSYWKPKVFTEAEQKDLQAKYEEMKKEIAVDNHDCIGEPPI